VIELSKYSLNTLRNDKEVNFYRGWSEEEISQILVLSPGSEYPAPEILKRLEHEYSLREELDSAWAARPIEIARHWDRTVLVLEDPGGVPLDQLLGEQLNLEFSLRVAVDLSGVIDRLHQRGIIHKEIKPANVLVNFCQRPLLVKRVWYRIAAPTRAPICRVSRTSLRDSRLYGTRRPDG
jgi:serine/threonine protein kinase